MRCFRRCYAEQVRPLDGYMICMFYGNLPATKLEGLWGSVGDGPSAR